MYLYYSIGNGQPGEPAMCQLYRSRFTSVHRTLQCFDAVGWAAGRASSLKKTERWGAGMVICLERGADAYGPADATATQVVLDRGPLKRCVCVYQRTQCIRGFAIMHYINLHLALTL